MIENEAIGDEKERVQTVLQRFPQNFTGLGRMRNHTVKLHTKPDVKPVVDAPRPTPYHMEERANTALQQMLDNGVIEPHPIDEPTPWISNTVLCPKDDGSL